MVYILHSPTHLNPPTVYAALSKLEKATRHWPMVYADTLIYTLTQVGSAIDLSFIYS